MHQMCNYAQTTLTLPIIAGTLLMVSRFQMLFALICNEEPLNDYLPRLHCGLTSVYSYIKSLVNSSDFRQQDMEKEKQYNVTDQYMHINKRPQFLRKYVIVSVQSSHLGAKGGFFPKKTFDLHNDSYYCMDSCTEEIPLPCIFTSNWR